MDDSFNLTVVEEDGSRRVLTTLEQEKIKAMLEILLKQVSIKFADVITDSAMRVNPVGGIDLNVGAFATYEGKGNNICAEIHKAQQPAPQGYRSEILRIKSSLN